ncbi:MAG TPA: hypothetical protein VLA34_00370, partial [Candidatus Krumholzibacterium sp.]|nr:hypothetical protein [Candidatus Krumholzibacterium sp.]
APSIAVDRIEPGVFSPGFPTDTSTVDIYYIVSGYETGSEGLIYFTSPKNAHFSFPVEVSGDGENLFRWAPLAEFPSGIYTFDISITDDAGNSSMDSGAVELDTDDPEVVILTEVGFRTRQPPLTMTGYCRDASGIRTGSLELRWGQNDSGGVPYETGPFDPDATWMQGDTLYWSYDLPDTVTGVVSYEENTYMLKVSCYDNYDMYRQATRSFTLDRTPPGAPVILNPGGVVIRPTLGLELEYDSDVDSLFITRRFEGTSTTFGILEMMDHEVDLEPGLNEIWVAAKDEAGNLGPDSEILEVTYSTEAGFEFPEAFREPGMFQIVTPQPVRGIVIYIYDMGGEHVRRLEEWSGSTVYTIAWDLLNDDGEAVRNGPYLMVMTIYGLDGSSTVRKEFIAVVK